MDNILKIISETRLFEGLPEQQLKKVSYITIKKEFGKGDIIFCEGDDANGFYIVVKGRVKIFKVSMEGKEHILHIFDPGEPFGEVPVFSNKPFPAHAEAIAKTSLLFFPKEAFVQLITEQPSLALNMLGVLSMRLHQFTVQIENLSLKEVPGRLAAYLLLLSEEQDQAGSVSLNISKGQLASLLGTIPETLSRIFAKMSSAGLIEVDAHIIKLIDMDGLEELSENGKI